MNKSNFIWAGIVGGLVAALIFVALGFSLNGQAPTQKAGYGSDTNLYSLSLESGISAASGTFSGTLNVAGETNVSNLVIGDADGSVPSVTATTSTLTAAQVCDNSVINFAAVPATSTITLPHATSTVADCLTADGDFRILYFRNTSSSGQTTTFASSTGETFVKPFNVSSTFTLAGGSNARVTLIRTSSTTLDVIFDRNN